MIAEKWLPVEGFEDVAEVSNFGNFRAISTRPGTYEGRPLTPGRYIGRHPWMRLRKRGKKSGIQVRVAVALAFVSGVRLHPCIFPHHRDGDAMNNRSDNLQWPTEKPCNVCGEVFPLESYGLRYAGRNYSVLRTECKRCALLKTNARNSVRIIQRKTMVQDIMSASGCVDCGENDLVVLEFDHVRGTKKYTIAEMVNTGSGLESILAEVAKCEVRCANCHRRRTAKQFNWTRLQRGKT